MGLQKINITSDVLDLFTRYKVYTSSSSEQRLKIGDVIGLIPATSLENYSHILSGRVMPCALGAFSYSHSAYHHELSIGRYCSISWGMSVIAGDHPMDWATTSPFSHHPYDMPGVGDYLRNVGTSQFLLHRFDQGLKPARLGHDVWLGQNVLVKRGVTIGHGAVIGAGSVVAKDIPPYAIAAGVPARVLRYRFPADLIDRFLKLEWWRYGPEVLQPLDVREPAAFLDRLEERIAAGLEPANFTALTGHEIIAAGEKVV